VNVWTPELDAFQAESLHKQDYKRYLVDHDPEELIEESRNAWRCIGKIVLFFCCTSGSDKLNHAI